MTHSLHEVALEITELVMMDKLDIPAELFDKLIDAIVEYEEEHWKIDPDQ